MLKKDEFWKFGGRRFCQNTWVLTVLCPSQSGCGSCCRQISLLKKPAVPSVCKHSFKWEKIKSVSLSGGQVRMWLSQLCWSWTLGGWYLQPCVPLGSLSQDESVPKTGCMSFCCVCRRHSVKSCVTG